MTLRLAGIALDHWRAIDGFAVSQNMPALGTLALDRFTSFIWWYATRNAESEQAIAKFEAALWRPPPNLAAPIPKESPWSPEAENAALSNLKASLAGGG